MVKDSKDIESGSPVYDAVGTPIQDNFNAKPKQEGASVLMLLLISFPRLAIQMAWSAQWAALGPYLSTMLSHSSVQATQLIGPLTGILVAPTIGALSDQSTSKYGRRRPYLFWAAIGSVICYILMGYTREMGESLGDYGDGSDPATTHRPWTQALTIFFYLWMDITVNVVQTPMFLLIADFAGERQTLGASLGQGWSLIGSIMVAGYIEFWGAAYLTLHWFLGMLALMMGVTVLVCCIVAKEIPLEKDENDKSSAISRVGNAFAQIYHGLRALPYTLIIYCIIFFTVCYGYTAYNGNKGQFFGYEVYGGVSDGADSCGAHCTKEQKDYNHGVKLAGGRADLLFNIAGYLYSWTLPFLVKKVGAQRIVIASLIPQALLIVMAFTKVVAIDVIFVILQTFPQATFFALLVPVIVHVMGPDCEIGVFVGALNSANCFGQLLNFAIGSGIVNTSLGYELPVMIGGIVGTLGLFVAIFFFRIEMYSM